MKQEQRVNWLLIVLVVATLAFLTGCRNFFDPAQNLPSCPEGWVDTVLVVQSWRGDTLAVGTEQRAGCRTKQ